MYSSLTTIHSVIQYNLEIYLFDHLKKIPVANHGIARIYFENDIKRITRICEAQNLIPLTLESIQAIHRALYPDGFVQKSKDEYGNEFIWMIPGEFRNIELTSKQTSENPYSHPNEIKNKVSTLIQSFNRAIENIQNGNQEEIKDTITRFVLDLVRIHPFGDGNGRIAGVLSDVLFLKHSIQPIGLLRCYKLHKDTFTQILIQGNSRKNLEKLYEFTEKNQDMSDQ